MPGRRAAGRRSGRQGPTRQLPAPLPRARPRRAVAPHSAVRRRPVPGPQLPARCRGRASLVQHRVHRRLPADPAGSRSRLSSVQVNRMRTPWLRATAGQRRRPVRLYSVFAIQSAPARTVAIIAGMDVALIVLLPFLGACVPPLTARSGRNVCAGATAAVTFAALLLLLARAPAVFQRRGGRLGSAVGSADRAVVLVLYRRARAVFRRTDPRDRSADYSLRAVLSEPRGPDRKVLRLSAAVPGRDGRHRAKRQSAAVDRLLGTDEPHLVSADRVLAPSAAGPPGGAHGAGRDRRRRAGADRRHADPRPTSPALTS